MEISGINYIVLLRFLVQNILKCKLQKQRRGKASGKKMRMENNYDGCYYVFEVLRGSNCLQCTELLNKLVSS